MAVANRVGRLIIGQGGILSTPAASCLIRKYKAEGGIILSASHNPGGPDYDFGIKYNVGNGGPAPESVTEQFYICSQNIAEYRIFESADTDIDELGESQLEETTILVIDPVDDYTQMLSFLFDFDLIKQNLAATTITLCFDAMHAVTGPYGRKIFEDILGDSALNIFS